jgi:GcrA cell cycle regulator
MPAAKHHRWTSGRDDCIRSMWVDHSAQQIADFIGGVSRHAVLGRLNRLGLLGQPSPHKKIYTTRLQRRPSPRPRPPRPIDPVPAPLLTEADMLLLHLVELNSNSCRFIAAKDGFNGSVYCGIECEPQDCGPYCSMHRAVMFRIPIVGPRVSA